jgi:hypothetical protein
MVGHFGKEYLESAIMGTYCTMGTYCIQLQQWETACMWVYGEAAPENLKVIEG